jgi:hypothetical protein
MVERRTERDCESQASTEETEAHDRDVGTVSSKLVQLASRGINTSGDLKEYLAALIEAITTGEVPMRKAEAIIKAGHVIVRTLEMEWRQGRNLPLHARNGQQTMRQQLDELRRQIARLQEQLDE